MPGAATVARGNIVLEMIMSVSLNPNNGTNIPANTTVETTYTLSGVLPNDFLEINKPTHTTGLSIGNIRAAAKDTIAVQWGNLTASPLAVSAENYLITVTRADVPTLPAVIS